MQYKNKKFSDLLLIIKITHTEILYYPIAPSRRREDKFIYYITLLHKVKHADINLKKQKLTQTGKKY